ncbi:MAG: glycosyltransferase [Chlorobium sp.]|nr:glycosyltransferase [Chlorobium sp.]
MVNAKYAELPTYSRGKVHTSTQCIVMAGNFSGLSTEFGLANGFAKLGWHVQQVDRTEYFGQSVGKFARVISRLKLPLAIRRYNKAIIEAVKAVKPHFFLTVKGSYITATTLACVRRLGAFTINYYPDLHFKHPGVNEDDFVHYDLFITTKSFQVDYLVRKLGVDRVAFLHHGYVAGFHEPPAQVDLSAEAADIVYIGNHSKEKEQWLRVVKERFPKANFKIYGNRWSTIADKEIFGSSIMGVPVHGKDFAKAIFSAKINLAIHMGMVGNSEWADLVSTRTFEIPACKGFMLHIDNEEIRQLFTPGVEIDVFKNMGELCEKIDFYLSHDNSRRAMLEKAYQRCVPAYSYDERAHAIADRLLLVE